jgi:hypothetical protein
MRKQVTGICALAALCAPLLLGCREDPPPPPPPPPASGTAKSADAPPKTSRNKVPRISAETMKLYRVETCYFGSMGLAVTRDAYLSSMGNASPSKDKLPSLGEFPGVRKPGDKDTGMRDRAPILAMGRQMPFVRHVRGCSIAKSLKEPANSELDAAVVVFEKYVSEVNKTLLDASRYYTRKQWEKDDFKRAKQMDEQLKKSLPLLDEKLATFGAVVNKWVLEQKPSSEKLDDAAKLAQTILAESRAVALMVITQSGDAAKIGEAIGEIEKKHEQLKEMGGGDAKQVPHPRVMTSKIQAFVAAVKVATATDGKPTAVQQFPVTSAMADLIEANQRAMAQLLRGRGDVRPTRPMRLLDPRMSPRTPRGRGKPGVRPTADPARAKPE